MPQNYLMKIKSFISLSLIVLTYCSIKAQPGWVDKVVGNLNNIDSTQIKNCIKADQYCYFGAIDIDSTTDLSRLVHLNSTPELHLNLNLSALPKTFSQNNWNKVKSLHISSTSIKDLSHLPQMQNLERLSISGFQNDTLYIQGPLPQLKILRISYSDQLTNIEQLYAQTAIEHVNIQFCQHIHLGDSSFKHLKEVHFIGNKPSALQWEDLSRFKQLEKVSLNHVIIDTLPDDFPKSLNTLFISDGLINLDLLKQLSELESMKSIDLHNSKVIWRK